MTEHLIKQRLIKVDSSTRKYIAMTTSTNRRMSQNWQQEQLRKKGHAACTWCGAEPCGHLWTRPGGAAQGDRPGGDRCCEKCSHAPVEGWQHTHTAWDGGQHHPVCAIPMHEGDVVYMRRDGVAMIMELCKPSAPGPDGEATRSFSSAVLGRDAGGALFVVGDGGETGVNLWEYAEPLDIVWLQARMLAGVARDELRRQAIAEELARVQAENDRLVALREAEEAAKKHASIEKKALQHEARLVLDDLDESGLPPELAEDETDDDDDAEEIEPLAADATPVKKAVNLKDPRPVKTGPGRPKRSFRQRRARERQKRAWVRAEARSRLEVKRLERKARAEAEKLVKEE